MSDRDIIPVILAGGAGRRLWPLSRKKKPKPFLHVPGKYSMFQQTLLRVRDFGPPVIICGADHYAAASAQAAAIGIRPQTILAEPASRNTAPAIAAAAHYVAGTARLKDGAPRYMLALPADHVMGKNDVFLETVRKARGLADQGYLVTFGIKPSAPETRYGYICKGLALEGEGAFRVASFTEKPDVKKAKDWISQGNYYWNSGMVFFDAKAGLAIMREVQSDLCDKTYMAVAKATRLKDAVSLQEESHLACEDVSFDVAILEKTSHAATLELDIPWKDLGTWQALLSHLLKSRKLG